jgi:hypothetical protein
MSRVLLVACCTLIQSLFNQGIGCDKDHRRHAWFDLRALGEEISPITEMRFVYSVMIRSAHSTSDTKIVGLPNFAPHWLKSVSATPLARQQAPQA